MNPDEHEGDGTGEEAERDQRAADQFHRAGEQQKPVRHLIEAGQDRKIQEFAGSMLHEKQSDHDPEDRLQLLATKTQV